MFYYGLILLGFIAFGSRRTRHPTLVSSLASAVLLIDFVIALSLPASSLIA